MKNITRKFLFGLRFVLGLLLFAFMVSPDLLAYVPEVFTTILAPSGMVGILTAANVAVPGGTITEKYIRDEAATLFERDVDDIVVAYMPDRFPITTILQNMKKKQKATSRKVEWIEVGYHARKDSVKVTTSEGSDNVPVEVEVDNVDMWGAKDVIFVPEVTVEGEPLRLFVTEVNSGTGKIKVLAANAGVKKVPVLTAADKLFRVTRSAASTDAQTTPHGKQGIEIYNWAQTFIGQFEIEILLKKMKRYMNDETVQRDLELFDFRNQPENAIITGVRNKLTVGGKDHYMTGGIEQFAGQSDTYDKAKGIDNNKWIDMSRNIFTGNAGGGSQSRLVVGGADFIASVLKAPTIQKQLEGKKTELKLGVHVNEISTNFGDIYLKYHPGFDECGRSWDAFALDMNHICLSELEPMHETELDLAKSGQRRVDATVIHHTAALKVRYPDTHTIITGITVPPTPPEGGEQQ